mgnify:CR=1 FL=1
MMSTENASFNPTRVRLKHIAREIDAVSDELQPHEGSSETEIKSRSELRDGELQPHEGSSETRGERSLAAISPCFNPTRVRLKPQAWGIFAPQSSLQPHEGSSETDNLNNSLLSKVCFNPTRVRLKRRVVGVGRTAVRVASTPRGFV